jgi:hypothetical protein
MKSILLSKTVGVLGLITALSALVGSSFQPAAQAQTAAQSLSQQRTQQVERSVVRAIPGFCEAFAEGNYSGLPARYYDNNGNFRNFAFLGIDLTPELQAVYDRAERRLSERAAAVDAETKKEVIPGGTINYFTTDPNGGIPDAIVDKLNAAVDAANSDNIPNADQVRALTEQFSQYKVGFAEDEVSLFTPEQILEIESIEREFVVTMAIAMNPEQRETFLNNWDAQNAVKSCTPRLLAQ